MSEIKDTIEEMLERQATLVRKKAVLEGRVEEATERLKSLEESCEAKGIDPNALDDVIEKLEAKIQDMTEKYEAQLAEAEEKMNAILANMKGNP